MRRREPGDVVGVGCVRVLGPRAREQEPLRSRALVRKALPPIRGQQRAIGRIDALALARPSAVSRLSGTFPVTAESQRLTKTDATDATDGSRPASMRRSMPRRYASAAAR
jgi:hypothetical protein